MSDLAERVKVELREYGDQAYCCGPVRCRHCDLEARIIVMVERECERARSESEARYEHPPQKEPQ